MSMTFPTETVSGATPRHYTNFTEALLKARYRTSVGDSNAANKAPLIIQGAPSQTANLLEVYNSSRTGLFAVDANGNTVYGGSTNVTNCCAQVSLTAAQIIAMYTTPVSVIPAPAAGSVILVEQILVELDLTATAFSGGGVVHFYYHGQTTEVMAQTIAAATVNGGAARTLYVLEPVQTAGGSVATTDVGIDITNATGVFAAGTGTAKITIWYTVVTEG
jgi:hypothetical protein